jgi:hypothetical protein
MQPYIDLQKAMDTINNGPVLDNMVIEMGKHRLKLEKVATMYHRVPRWGNNDSYVFRVVLDGKEVWEGHGLNRVFIHPIIANRDIVDRIWRVKPKWLPKDVHLKIANNMIDRAMMTMLSLSVTDR